LIWWVEAAMYGFLLVQFLVSVLPVGAICVACVSCVLVGV
jgi:hypothetical protein